ncbi:MAG: cytochrome P450 [Myxococcales bacterium]|nr:cytochrome P450 [Myxococcales bacterium]MCB9629137.1 cytochrome P450 [Sandaracinaceae bacterium]
MTSNAATLPYDQRPPNQRLGHIKGHDGLPMLGRTIDMVRDPSALFGEYFHRFGKISRVSITGFRTVLLNHPDYAEVVLLDHDKNFSCKMGWKSHMGEFFDGGLVMRDFGEHRSHRRIATESFRREAMLEYASQVQAVTEKTVARWGATRDIVIYDEIKKLLLDIAFNVFCWLDESDKAEIPNINRAFADMMEGSVGYVRFNIPGLAYHRGLKGRAYLKRFFLDRIDRKRASDDRDSFAAFCRATDENGQPYSDEDIANHMVFLMLAAHDTTASAATMAAYYLAQNQDIQDELRADLDETERPIAYDTMFRTLPLMAGVFHETIRLHPPVAMLLRRTVDACEIDGVAIPADTMVCVPVAFLQRHPDFWSEPDRFDPHRFDEDRLEHRKHPFMWLPFGGGPHKCIGLHFARLLFTSLYAELLSEYRIEFAKPGYYPTGLQHLPFAKPKDGLPVRLVPR